MIFLDMLVKKEARSTVYSSLVRNVYDTTPHVFDFEL